MAICSVQIYAAGRAIGSRITEVVCLGPRRDNLGCSRAQTSRRLAEISLIPSTLHSGRYPDKDMCNTILGLMV